MMEELDMHKKLMLIAAMISGLGLSTIAFNPALAATSDQKPAADQKTEKKAGKKAKKPSRKPTKKPEKKAEKKPDAAPATK